jgi:hypothetical protein
VKRDPVTETAGAAVGTSEAIPETLGEMVTPDTYLLEEPKSRLLMVYAITDAQNNIPIEIQAAIIFIELFDAIMTSRAHVEYCF